MRKSLVLAFFVVFLPLVCAQKVRYGQKPPKATPGVDYPVKVHVEALRVSHDCNEGNSGWTCGDQVHLNAVIDQKRLELTCGFLFDSRYYQLNLLPGNYTARLFKANKGAAAPLFDEYEFLLPDQRIWRCTVTGISE